MDLVLDVNQHGAHCVLGVRGEIDVSTAPRFRECLIGLVNDGHRQVVADLSEVDFLDSVGLGVLVGGLKRLRSHEGNLSLVCTQGRILKVFEITGLDTVFTVHASVAEAVAET